MSEPKPLSKRALDSIEEDIRTHMLFQVATGYGPGEYPDWAACPRHDFRFIDSALSPAGDFEIGYMRLTCRTCSLPLVVAGGVHQIETVMPASQIEEMVNNWPDAQNIIKKRG